jgi:hypothetical protein
MEEAGKVIAQLVAELGNMELSEGRVAKILDRIKILEGLAK